MGTKKSTRLLIIGMLAAMHTPGFASEPRDRLGNSPSTNSAPEAALPAAWISSQIPAPVRSRVESSFALATLRLKDLPECAGLFSDFGANGLEVLSSTLYYPASAAQEKRACRGAWGYTTVGTAPTYLCRRFSRMSEKKGAMILIHEALHHAGMGEFPQDRNALSSAAINSLVEDACGL